MKENFDYLFVPSNDSQVEWMIPIANLLSNSGFMIFDSRKENAPEFLKRYFTGYVNYEPGILENLKPQVVIVGNDWGFEELLILLEANALNIKTVCIQDGAIIYPDKVRRLLNADFLFAFGKKTLEYFPHPNNYLTGNPKFDHYYPAPLPSEPRIMINYNFNYGIYTEYGEQWLKDIVSSLSDLGLEGFISLHPRSFLLDDWTGNLNVYKSKEIPLKQQITDSSIVISRFSTLVYESIACGRRVIYYNPHQENFDLFRGENKDFLVEVCSKEELKKQLIKFSSLKEINQKMWIEYMKYHLTTVERNSASLCANALRQLLTKSIEHSVNEEKFMFLSKELLRASEYFYRYYVNMQKELSEHRENWFVEQRYKDYISQLLSNIKHQNKQMEENVIKLNFLLKKSHFQISRQSQIISVIKYKNEELIRENESLRLDLSNKQAEIKELQKKVHESFLLIPPSSAKTFLYLSIRSIFINVKFLRKWSFIKNIGKFLKRMLGA